MDKNKNQEPREDIHLDIPSEANREKHISFREAEEDNSGRSDDNSTDDFVKERRKEWERGIAEGKEQRKESDT